MLAYFEEHIYLGPNSEAHIQLAKEIATENFTSLNEWIKQNNEEMKKNNNDGINLSGISVIQPKRN